MKLYTLYDDNDKILCTGVCCTKSFPNKAGSGEHIIEGIANPVTQKIVGGKIVDKTLEEIELEKPPKPKLIPIEKRPADITNEQLQSLVDRIDQLEAKQEKEIKRVK